MSSTLSVESGSDLILALLYAPGKGNVECEPIRGITRLEKLMFLLHEGEDLKNILREPLRFVPWDVGPYSAEIYDLLEMLIDGGLVVADEEKIVSYWEVSDGRVIESDSTDDFMALADRPTTVKVYKLTEKGKKVGRALFESLPSSKRTSLVEIKVKFNQEPLKDLIRYVYKSFPKMTTESRVLKELA